MKFFKHCLNLWTAWSLEKRLSYTSNWSLRFSEGFTHWSRFFRLFVTSIMVVAAAISSKLIFLNDEENFIE